MKDQSIHEAVTEAEASGALLVDEEEGLVPDEAAEEEVRQIDELPGLKLEDMAPGCFKCRRKLGNTNNITFYRLRVERFIIDLRAARRRVGLEMMIGHAGIAAVMDSGDEFARPVMLPVEVLVCEDCAFEIGHLCEVKAP